MRRPDVRIRVQLLCLVSLFTIVCLASLAAAIYTLSQRTLLDLEVGNLDLNCRMRRDESYQALIQVYQFFDRLVASTPIRSIVSSDNFDDFKSQADLLHHYFGPDRLLMLNIYEKNFTEILQIDSRAINDSRVPVSFLPLVDPHKNANVVAEIARETGGFMVGPMSVEKDPLLFDTTRKKRMAPSYIDFIRASTNPPAQSSQLHREYFLSLTLPINSAGVLAIGQDPVIGWATGLFSSRKLQQVLGDASFNLEETKVGTAALCIVPDNWNTLQELIPFNGTGKNSPSSAQDAETFDSQSIPLPAPMAADLKKNLVPNARPNLGPKKSMISIAPFLFLGHVYYVVVLQAHGGVYQMSYSLTTMVLIACFSIAAGVVLLTFLFVSFGVRQILKLKMATNYERPAPGPWPWLPWWLRPKESVESVIKVGESETKVPEKVPLGHHFRDEFDDITLRFNTMSDELRRQYSVLEDRVHDRKQEIETARQAANEANAAKSHFLARVTHELRTPLNGIIGTATLCMEEENISQVHQSLKTIFKCGELLLHLMTDLLSFSQYEVENHELEMHDFAVSEITSQLKAIFLEQCKMKGIELHVQSPAAYKDLVFYGDTNRILQVIFNLLSNGLKFTPENGHVYFTVKVEDKETAKLDLKPRFKSAAAPAPSPGGPGGPGGPSTASSSTPGSRAAEPKQPNPDEFPWPCEGYKVVTFTVQDTGPGIAPSLQSKVFEAFVQGDISTSVRKAGVGLGLSICRQLAERMNGSISLESELNKGSTFSFSVPLWYVHADSDSSRGFSSPGREMWPESELYSPLTASGSDTQHTKDLTSASGSDTHIPSGDRDKEKEKEKYHDPALPTLQEDSPQGKPRPCPPTLRDPSPFMPTITGDPMPSLSVDVNGGSLYGTPRSAVDEFDANYIANESGVQPHSAPFVKWSPPENINIQDAARLDSSAGPSSSTPLTPFSPTIPSHPTRPAMQGRPSFTEHPPSHIRVLVVDDNKVNQEVMKRMLNLEGLMNIKLANDGFEAISRVEEAQTADEPFDVIFMDVQMPNMDGRKATKVLRKDYNFRAPIVAVSAFANEENASDCVAAGMNLFLSKPLRRPHLRSILRSLSEMHHSPGVTDESSQQTSPQSGDEPNLEGEQ